LLQDRWDRASMVRSRWLHTVAAGEQQRAQASCTGRWPAVVRPLRDVGEMALSIAPPVRPGHPGAWSLNQGPPDRRRLFGRLAAVFFAVRACWGWLPFRFPRGVESGSNRGGVRIALLGLFEDRESVGADEDRWPRRASLACGARRRGPLRVANVPSAISLSRKAQRDSVHRRDCAGFDPGAGSGRVTKPQHARTGKDTAAKRPNSLRDPAAPCSATRRRGAGRYRWAIDRPISPTSRSGRTTAARPVQLPGRAACPPLPRCAANGSLTIEARSNLSWEQISTPGFTSVKRRHWRQARTPRKTSAGQNGLRPEAGRRDTR